MTAQFLKLRWVCLVAADVVGLAGCALYDPRAGLALGLIVVGFQWLVTGIAIFNRSS